MEFDKLIIPVLNDEPLSRGYGRGEEYYLQIFVQVERRFAMRLVFALSKVAGHAI